ncbi:hypothetical protein TKK_0016272 [Trichogramma kaykai]
MRPTRSRVALLRRLTSRTSEPVRSVTSFASFSSSSSTRQGLGVTAAVAATRVVNGRGQVSSISSLQASLSSRSSCLLQLRAFSNLSYRGGRE